MKNEITFSFIMITIDQLSLKIQQQINNPLPGEKAQQLTQVTGSANVEFPYLIEKAMPAAVLILLFPYNNDIHFFLTKRTNEVNITKGKSPCRGAPGKKVKSSMKQLSGKQKKKSACQNKG